MSVLKQNLALADALQELSDEPSSTPISHC